MNRTYILDWATFVDNKHSILQTMQHYGGNFAQKLADLLICSDPQRLKANFLANIDTIAEYAPGSPLFESKKKSS
jgi:hypothetical protein